MLVIYSEEITPRLEYIAKLIFTQILQVEVEFTTNSSDFIKLKQPKLNYSLEKFGDEFYIKPHRLLFCKALIHLDFKPVWYEGEKYFFESSKDSTLPFDPLAASFYLVTRYEEYLETERGRYNRFPAEKSVLAKYQLLQKPVVNIWARLIAEKLKERFPGLIFSKPKFSFISTIDVDNAWAFSNKGFLRSGGALAKSLLRGHFDEVKQRMNVLLGHEKDPYDTYDFLDSVFHGNNDKVHFFFLLGDYARYDKNISYKNKQFVKLIKKTVQKYTVGIHPSFASSRKKGKKKLNMEIRRLQEITGTKMQKSRQHFLRLQFPRTYRRLINAGIDADFTMGYASQAGFRAGICNPFYFYDLKKEKTTNLKIFPFQVMDVTLRDYMGLTPDEALQEIEKLMGEVKKVGGTFISIWHNETVNDLGRWKGFRAVFEKMNKIGFEWANES